MIIIAALVFSILIFLLLDLRRELRRRHEREQMEHVVGRRPWWGRR